MHITYLSTSTIKSKIERWWIPKTMCSWRIELVSLLYLSFFFKVIFLYMEIVWQTSIYSIKISRTTDYTSARTRYRVSGQSERPCTCSSTLHQLHTTLSHLFFLSILHLRSHKTIDMSMFITYMLHTQVLFNWK